VVTNQPDVASGVQRIEVVEAMHERLRRELAIDDIRACYHLAQDDCACRKPRPGMLLDAARDHDIDLPRSFIVGDRWRDVLAGQNAGCAAFFIDYGYDERRPDPPFTAVTTLLEAACLIERQIPLPDDRTRTRP
jgi:D-glycero-D-manno-heptose 1,7-bisphosphate phosphatase